MNTQLHGRDQGSWDKGPGPVRESNTMKREKQLGALAFARRPGYGLLALLSLALLAGSGCTRTFWRRQADLDAYALVREKATHPHWRFHHYTPPHAPSPP